MKTYKRHIILIYIEAKGWTDDREIDSIPFEEAFDYLQLTGYAWKEFLDVIRYSNSGYHMEKE